jgi:predicted nucleic acid-binding protein
MKVLFDTNVILDVLLDREPFSAAASLLLAKAEQGEIAGFACATTITTIYYLAAKILGAKMASCHVQSLLSLLNVAPVNKLVLENAVSSQFRDFEDAVLHEAALLTGVQHIVTRNASDFKNSLIPIHEPEEFLHAFELLKKAD